jgi:hypothetical protein
VKNALIYSISLFSSTLLLGQKSEMFIPKDAVTVFSINNINLLQKISMDDLVNYEFMEEVHQELFDGSTDNKSLKDAGIDFDQRLNIFYGKNQYFELSGFTFGIKNEKSLFSVFDDFDPLPTEIPGAKAYGSFFNNLVIKSNNALLIRVEPIESSVLEITDSIWFSRGNMSPYYNGFEIDAELSDDELMKQDLEYDLREKNYNELRDSIQFVLQNQYLNTVLNGLFKNGESLYSMYPKFQEVLLHPVAGVFYMDNERNFDRAKNLWYLKSVLPTLYLDVQELYEGNVIVGDLVLKDKAIDFNISAAYSEPLGSIYMEMNDSKFDKRISKYIKQDQSAFFTYNINLKKAYEKAYEIVLPILGKEKNVELSMNVLLLKLANEFINKDALFDTYKGTMFGTFNGIKKVKTRKIEFFYNEDTFEYGERETDAEEDMPIFTLGFTTARPDVPELILDHLSNVTSKFEKKENYWIYKQAIFDAAPVYMINTEGLFIFTNDEDLALNHSEGYGKEGLNSKTLKSIKNSGSLCGYADLKSVANQFPIDFLLPEQQPLMESLRGKSGNMVMRSGKTTVNKTELSLSYSFETNEDSGKHLLDMLNTLYLITK